MTRASDVANSQCHYRDLTNTPFQPDKAVGFYSITILTTKRIRIDPPIKVSNGEAEHPGINVAAVAVHSYRTH